MKEMSSRQRQYSKWRVQSEQAANLSHKERKADTAKKSFISKKPEQIFADFSRLEKKNTLIWGSGMKLGFPTGKLSIKWATTILHPHMHGAKSITTAKKH